MPPLFAAPLFVFVLITAAGPAKTNEQPNAIDAAPHLAGLELGTRAMTLAMKLGPSARSEVSVLDGRAALCYRDGARQVLILLREGAFVGWASAREVLPAAKCRAEWKGPALPIAPGATRASLHARFGKPRSAQGAVEAWSDDRSTAGTNLQVRYDAEGRADVVAATHWDF